MHRAAGSNPNWNSSILFDTQQVLKSSGLSYTGHVSVTVMLKSLIVLYILVQTTDGLNHQDVWNHISQNYNSDFLPSREDGNPVEVAASSRLVNLIKVVCFLK